MHKPRKKHHHNHHMHAWLHLKPPVRTERHNISKKPFAFHVQGQTGRCDLIPVNVTHAAQQSCPPANRKTKHQSHILLNACLQAVKHAAHNSTPAAEQLAD
jgi:hypothetical protein